MNGLTVVQEMEGEVDRDYTFNAVLGYFTQDNRLCYSGTIKYLKIYPSAADVSTTSGELSVDIGSVKTDYSLGELFDPSGLKVTFTSSDGAETGLDNYIVTTNPVLMTGGEVTITVSAMGKTVTETTTVKVDAPEPQFYHWTGTLDGITMAEDSAGNTLTDEDGYFSMAKPVYLDPDNHWQIQWTGAVTEGRNAILLSSNYANNGNASNRVTPYIYIRNGGDNGQYDISISYSGTVGSAVAQFELNGYVQALENENTTWMLDYEDGKLSLFCNEKLVETKSVELQPLAFNGIGGYFAISNPLYYSGTLTDVKVDEKVDSYRWDFNNSNVNGNILEDTRGGIDLEYTGTLNVNGESFDNSRPFYFNMSKSITLPSDSSWTIEWQGTTDTDKNSVLLANNSAGDISSPNKAGEYIYIYNDLKSDGGNRISLRSGNLHSIATFVIPDGLREDPNVTWYLIHDGNGNLTLGWKGSDELYYTSTQRNVMKDSITFNGVLGYFTTNNNLSYTGSIKYLEITMEAKSLTNAEGSLMVNAESVKKDDYQPGDVLDLSNLVVRYVIGGSEGISVTDYAVTAEPAFLTPETTCVELTISALGLEEKVTVSNINVNAHEPQYYHWFGEDGLSADTDGTSQNTLKQPIGGQYDSMTVPVYLDADNHWQIQWTGKVTQGRNAVLLSENADYGNRLTPYLYIRNGGDNGEYDIALVYHGLAASDGANLVRFELGQSERSALTDEATWILDYNDGKLTLSNDKGYSKEQSVEVDDIAFNGIRGYFTNTSPLWYTGELTDVKIYESLHTITTGTVSNGTVTVPNTSVQANSEVTITVAPNDGYEMKEITVVDSGNTDIEAQSQNLWDGIFLT